MIDRLHILIVEDDSNSAQLLAHLVKPIIEKFPGCVISIRPTFNQAMEVILQDPAPDIVALDLSLTREPPFSTMPQTLARLHEVESRCPFLIVTGHDPQEVRRIANRTDLEIIEKRPDQMNIGTIIAAFVSAISKWQLGRAHNARLLEIRTLVSKLRTLCDEPKPNSI